jgi:hypothetical protein
VAGELIAGLRVVFAVFAEDMGADVQGVGLLLSPWLTRWISPDSMGAVDGLNLYIYVGNNPLKYIDPTGHFPLISWDIHLVSQGARYLAP